MRRVFCGEFDSVLGETSICQMALQHLSLQTQMKTIEDIFTIFSFLFLKTNRNGNGTAVHGTCGLDGVNRRNGRPRKCFSICRMAFVNE